MAAKQLIARMSATNIDELPVGYQMRLLLIEDDQLLAQGLVTALERMHYRVEHCINGKQGIQAASDSDFDVIILDLGLPDGLAVKVIQALRAIKISTPILVLTAWDHLDTKIEALDLGADDYILKPCDVREIEARIRVVVRRHQQREEDVLLCQDLALDLKKRECSYQGRTIRLTSREFLLLKEFMLHPDKILTKQYLEELNSGWSGETESNSVEVHIHNIRKKISNQLIRNIRGVGYMLVSQHED